MSTIQGLIKINPSMLGRVQIDDYSPRFWFTWGDKIIIDPIPDGNYKLALYVSDFPTTELMSDSDELSYIPHEFHECVVYFACYALLVKRKKWNLAKIYYNRYLHSLETRYKIYMDRKSEGRKLQQLPETVRRENNGNFKFKHNKVTR